MPTTASSRTEPLVKKTPLANSEGTGWLDYVANDLEALHDAVNGGRVYVDSKSDLFYRF